MEHGKKVNDEMPTKEQNRGNENQNQLGWEKKVHHIKAFAPNNKEGRSRSGNHGVRVVKKRGKKKGKNCVVPTRLSKRKLRAGHQKRRNRGSQPRN